MPVVLVFQADRVGAVDRCGDPAVAALEDLPEPVDEEVVVHVAVLQRLRRVGVETAHDRG